MLRVQIVPLILPIMVHIVPFSFRPFLLSQSHLPMIFIYLQ